MCSPRGRRRPDVLSRSFLLASGGRFPRLEKGGPGVFPLPLLSLLLRGARVVPVLVPRHVHGTSCRRRVPTFPRCHAWLYRKEGPTDWREEQDLGGKRFSFPLFQLTWRVLRRIIGRCDQVEGGGFSLTQCCRTGRTRQVRERRDQRERVATRKKNKRNRLALFVCTSSRTLTGDGLPLLHASGRIYGVGGEPLEQKLSGSIGLSTRLVEAARRRNARIPP